MILISVVIVNYKSWDSLSSCLESFKEFEPQTKHEIIVVDNDSKDGYFELFSKNYPSVNFIKNSGNNGFPHACNLGAKNSSGKFLLFLNPDTVLNDSNAIDGMFNFASDNPTIGITSCRKINTKGNSEREMTFSSPWLTISWIRAIYKIASSSIIKDSFPNNEMLWYPEWITGSVVMISSRLFYAVGKWSHKHYWMYYEDVDLCLKVKQKNKKIALLRDLSIMHNHGGSSRININTIAITKSEVITSWHAFVQLHTKGLNRVSLHIVIIVNTLISQLLKVALTSLVFWKISFRANILVLIATFNYYINALICGTWKSKRIVLDE